MAELIDANEIMFTQFQPKSQNRFIMYIEGIPAYLIKGVSRPSPSTNKVAIDHINKQWYVAGKTIWADVSMTLYDPVVPSGAQTIMEWLRLQHESVTGRDGYLDFYKKDLTINMLGPVGDIVEEWTLKGAFPISIDFGSGDWTSDTQMEINVTLSIDYAILNF